MKSAKKFIATNNPRLVSVSLQDIFENLVIWKRKTTPAFMDTGAVSRSRVPSLGTWHSSFAVQWGANGWGAVKLWNLLLRD
ncbi:MAG: hypothetical protein ABJ081_12150 [Hyphomicrobiales bacterium]